MPRSAARRVIKSIAGALAAALLFAAWPVASPTARAATAPGVRTGPSGLPLPRFVSLKADRVNVRVGPGEDYRIAWVFVRPGLPVEIIQEFDNWRRIRDAEGAVGWVFHSLLSGERTAVVTPWEDGAPRPIRASSSADAAVTAYLEPGVLAEVKRCENDWCRLSGKGFSGWIAQDQLWGVYPHEDIE